MARDVDHRQIRAARGLLDWTQVTLAERSGLSLPTIKRIENERRGASAPSFKRAVAALEEAGVAFLGTDALDETLISGVALRHDFDPPALAPRPAPRRPSSRG